MSDDPQINSTPRPTAPTVPKQIPVAGREQFARRSGTREYRHVPQGEGLDDVRIRSLTETERSSVVRLCQDQKDFDRYAARLMAMSVVNNDGDLLFNVENDDDITLLAEMPLPDAQPVTEAIQKLNGLDRSVEDDAKN
ncbi:MAG: hypothetical protein ACPGWS_08550 [Solirubrobacterales bacterium]